MGVLAISLGPLALPVAPLLLAGAVLAASALASSLARRPATAAAGTPGADERARRGERAGAAFTTAALLGLVAARAVWLLQHADTYLAWPAAALDIRDGGWHAGAGLAAGAAWLLWCGWRHAALRRALAIAAAAGCALWWAASAALGGASGAPLPGVELVALDSGQPQGLRQAAAGRPAVVVLWASWCGPCRDEMPLLAAAQQREPGLRFLFVNQGEPAATVQRYLGSLPVNLGGVLLDPGSALGAAVGSPGLPTTLFYDASGRRIEAHFGVLNAAALDIRLRALKPGPPMAPR